MHAKHYNLNSPIGAFRKGKQSKSVRNKKEFLSYNQNAINALKENLKNELNIKTYSFLRKKYLKQFMSIVPSKIINKLFKEDLLYDVVTYSFESDKFFIEKENSFKY